MSKQLKKQSPTQEHESIAARLLRCFEEFEDQSEKDFNEFAEKFDVALMAFSSLQSQMKQQMEVMDAKMNGLELLWDYLSLNMNYLTDQSFLSQNSQQIQDTN